MAKTTSEIVKENKEREKIAQQIADAMKARDERDANVKETTEATEAVEVVAVEPVQESYLLPAVSGGVGFILGAVLMAVYFKLKIKRIQKDCETRISEARTTLDRVLEMATK